MTKNKRIMLFSLLFLILCTTFGLSSVLKSLKSEVYIIIFTALFMLGFTTLLIEHFFTKPADILAGSVSILLLLAPMNSILIEMGWLYYFILYYCLSQFLLAMISLLLLDDTQTEEHFKNRISFYTKTICTYFGNSKVLYFALFVVTLITYIDSQDEIFVFLFCYAISIILINPSKFTLTIKQKVKAKSKNLGLGSVVGVHSNNIFLVKLFKDYKKFEFLDPVFFKYKDGFNIREEYGVILDKYYLNDEQWARVLVDDKLPIGKLDNTQLIAINQVVLLCDNVDTLFVARTVRI